MPWKLIRIKDHIEFRNLSTWKTKSLLSFKWGLPHFLGHSDLQSDFWACFVGDCLIQLSGKTFPVGNKVVSSKWKQFSHFHLVFFWSVPWGPVNIISNCTQLSAKKRNSLMQSPSQSMQKWSFSYIQGVSHDKSPNMIHMLQKCIFSGRKWLKNRSAF